MRIVNSLDRETWSCFVQQHPNGSIFHTPEMFEVFQSTRRHVPLLLAALDSVGDALALLVSVKVRTLPWIFGPVSSRALLYAQPICRSSEQGGAALKAIVGEHDRRMRSSVLFTEVRPLSEDCSERAALIEEGYDHESYLNYLSDVRRSPEELVQRMNKHGRRDLRAGQRQELHVGDATCLEGIDILYSILQETYANARVPLADKDLFVNAVQILSPRKMMKVFLVHHEGIPVAGTIVLCHRDTAFFWYAGKRRGSTLHAMEVIVFAMLEWAHVHNYRIFDFGGAGRPDQKYGVRDFKAKLGGDLVNYGRYRKIYSPWKFAVAERAYEASRSLWSGGGLSIERQKRA
jgi:serine/alanine adding enzyme